MSDDIALAEIDVPKPDAEDLRLYSVTTIIKNSTSSEGLNYWGKEQVAMAAVADLDIVTVMAKKDERAAVSWLIEAPNRGKPGKRTAAQLGTAFHKWAEHLALAGEPPEVDDELRPLTEQFLRWCDAFQPKFEAAEMTVFDRGYGYAGTADAVMVLDGVRFIVDYKTSLKSFDKKDKPTKPYAEVGLQLAAYRYAECSAPWREIRRHEVARRRYYLLSPAEQALVVPTPQVDAALAIHVAPEHCNAHQIRSGEEMFEHFLDHRDAARFGLDAWKDVVGGPLEAPVRA